jgi:hypothetical protein
VEVRKRILWTFLLLALAACGGTNGDQWLVDIVMAQGVAEDYSPVGPTDQFAPDDVFYCAVLLRDLPDGETVNARWFFEGKEKDQLLYESTYQPGTGGSGYVAFELSSQGPWPAGDYRIELFIQEKQVGQAQFSVFADQP